MIHRRNENAMTAVSHATIIAARSAGRRLERTILPMAQMSIITKCFVFPQRPSKPLAEGEIMERGKVLDKAKEIINGARQDQYGRPEDSFSAIANFWNAYLKNIKGDLNSFDVAMMMALMKVARMLRSAGYEDSAIDACGYIALANDMVKMPIGVIND